MSDEASEHFRRTMDSFPVEEVLLMVVRLANGITQVNNAVAALAAGDTAGAAGASKRAGEAVDSVIRTLEEKLRLERDDG